MKSAIVTAQIVSAACMRIFIYKPNNITKVRSIDFIEFKKLLKKQPKEEQKRNVLVHGHDGSLFARSLQNRGRTGAELC